MKISLVYLRYIGKLPSGHPDRVVYGDCERRFHDTYLKFRPSISHDLIIVNLYDNKSESDYFDDIATQTMHDTGPGRDIGTYQRIIPKLDCDLVLCMSTGVHFWREEWLEIIAESADTHGTGIYGTCASFEHNPHIRTGCISFTPNLISKYPYVVDTTEKACAFEAGPENFSLRSIKSGYSVMLVTGDGCYQRQDWRKPDNIFRRGNQSNCLIWDKHTDIYFKASKNEREALSRLADGL